MTLDLIGDGPMLSALRAQATALGLEAGVLRFHGWKQHAEIAPLVASCNVLTFPSIREFGGGVVLEAMAMGLVPMVVDYAGPGELVTPDCGVKVPIGSRAKIVAGFRAELERLAADPASLEPMRRVARERVRAQFTWARKAEQIAAIWDQILREQPRKSRAS